MIYRAGYVLPEDDGRTLPHDVERATVLLVKAAWYARNRDPLIRSEDVDGVISTAYQVTGSGILPEVVALLTPYRQAVAL